jgi:transglutaminase-like putative cysteine protease
MPTLVALRHRTTYHYDRPVILGPQTFRLRPAPHARTPVRSYSLAVLPEPQSRHWSQDPQGNFLVRVLLAEPTASFELTVELTAELAELNPFDFFLEPDAATWPFRYPPLLEQELAPCLATRPVRPWLAGLFAGLSLQEQSSVDLLVGLNHLVHDRVAYLTRLEPGVQPPEQTLERGSGSCRDVAWLLVQAARSLGFAARFASGYLIQLADPQSPEAGIEADGADLHAWAEVYLPGAGWIGFDATSGLIAGAGHIPLASSVHPASAAPVSGTVEADVGARLEVETTVTRL